MIKKKDHATLASYSRNRCAVDQEAFFPRKISFPLFCFQDTQNSKRSRRKIGLDGRSWQMIFTEREKPWFDLSRFFLQHMLPVLELCSPWNLFLRLAHGRICAVSRSVFGIQDNLRTREKTFPNMTAGQTEKKAIQETRLPVWGNYGFRCGLVPWRH